MENDEWRRDLNFVTARSCEELLRQQPYTINGYYWVFYDNDYRPVWCDMKTDGGESCDLVRANQNAKWSKKNQAKSCI